MFSYSTVASVLGRVVIIVFKFSAASVMRISMLKFMFSFVSVFVWVFFRIL